LFEKVLKKAVVLKGMASAMPKIPQNQRALAPEVQLLRMQPLFQHPL
jgi:hypothetical protein